MSTELIHQPKDQDRMLRVMESERFFEMQQHIAKKMFDMGMVETPQAAEIILFRSAVRGDDPFEIIQREHLIKGKFTKKAEVMLADFNRMGGIHRWITDSTDDQKATIEFEYRGVKTQFTYTFQMAERAGLVKPNSQWIKGRESALRAAAIRGGLRMACPQATYGCIDEDEVGMWDEDKSGAPQATTVPSVATTISHAEPSRGSVQQGGAPAQTDEVIDVEPEPVKRITKKRKPKKDKDESTEPLPGQKELPLDDTDKVSGLLSLLPRLVHPETGEKGVTESWYRELIRKNKGKELEQLTHHEIAHLRAKLEAKIEAPF